MTNDDPPIVALAAIRTATDMIIVDIDDDEGYGVICRCGHHSPIIALLPQIAAAREIAYRGIIYARAHTA